MEAALPTRFETLCSVFRERNSREQELEQRYPWVPVLTKKLLAFLLLALLISGAVFWILDTIDEKADEKTAAALSARDAEQQAAALAAQQQKQAEAEDAEKILDAEAADCARAIYGIRLFIGKYHYSEADLMTYLRSAFNRVDATGRSLHDVLFDGQYLASYETNTVLTEYKELAKKAIREWKTETSKPCDISYQIAELTERGIYLKTDLDADGYAIRWRYSA